MTEMDEITIGNPGIRGTVTVGTPDAYQRMLDWCAQQHLARVQAGQQTVIEGTRTITHQQHGKDGERERGTIANDDFAGQDWLGDNVGQVIDLMDDSLGKVPEGNYRIVE